MTAEPRGVPTYPLWVGSLKETVKERDLLRVCSKHGVVANCKIMRDEQGNSKRFGYVNFYNEADAERAAEKLAGFQIQGTQLKTKGPRLLKKQGHFSVAHHRPTTPGATKTNYRPLTDCSFFIQGDKCKKGKNVSWKCFLQSDWSSCGVYDPGVVYTCSGPRLCPVEISSYLFNW